MRTPVRVTFRGVPHLDEIERLCWTGTQALTRSYAMLAGCTITIHRIDEGSWCRPRFDVRLRMSLPRGDLTARNDRASDIDMVAAVRNCFEKAERRLAEVTRRRPARTSSVPVTTSRRDQPQPSSAKRP